MTPIRLSYVVHVDDWATIDTLSRRLAAQTVAHHVELVAVGAPSRQQPAVLEPLGRVTIVPRPPGALARARVAGVRAAAGEIVALGETHVAPRPGWAEAVLAAHDAGADVVLPNMVNANPSSALSWAAFLMDYGRYVRSAGPGTPIPTYNATVRRALLMALADPEHALTPGTALDSDLRALGASVARAEGAILAHVNVDHASSWVRERLLGGLLLAEARRGDWGPVRRAVYACAAPAIAAVLFVRASRAPRPGAPRATGLALALGSGVWALGEAAGYLGLADEADADRMEQMELHKLRYTRTPV